MILVPEFRNVTVHDLGMPPSRKILILVPYRNRKDHLKTFLPYMRRFLPDAHIWIIEQSDDGRKFNRGALLNAGSAIAMKEGYSHIIYHDVDVLPRAPLRPYYEAFPEKPVHIGWAWTSKYDYGRFFGGIVSMRAADIRKTRGFPNQMWGWGGEDDELRNRVARAKLTVVRPMERGPLVVRDLAHRQASGDEINHAKHYPDRGGVFDVHFSILSVRSRKDSPIRHYVIELQPK